LTLHLLFHYLASSLTKEIFVKKFVSAVLILFVCSSALFAADLKTYKATYAKRMAMIVLEHGISVSKLNESYKKALNNLNDQVTKAGDLTAIKAVMAEMARFVTAKTVTVEDAKNSSPHLKKMQLYYMQSLESFGNAKANRIIKLTSNFDSALARLQKSLAQQRKLDDATAVMAERDAVAKSYEVVSAMKMVSEAVENIRTTANSNVDKQAPEPKARKVLASALSKDLLLHYTFDNVRQNKVEDKSGKRNHGMVVGAPEKVAGVRGSAVALDGRKDMIVVQARKSNLTNVHESDYTLALWFKPLSKPNMARGNGPSGLLMKAGTDVGLYYTKDQAFEMVNWLFVKANNPDLNTYVVTRSAPLTLDNEWVYIVATLNKKDKAIKLYVDGELEKERVWEYDWSPAPNGSPWRIGMADLGRCMSHGAFDEVRIYSRSLAADEVRKLYETTAPKQ
jgi:hypothetical protein